jgi:outer membrane lipoprotein-sorting protein
MLHILITLLLLNATTLFAAGRDTAEFIDKLNQEETSTIKLLQSYLNSITTLVADFIQIDPNGESSTGKLFISRPGKLRWQYDPPNPILIIVRGSKVSYYDYALDQLTYISADENLISFFTRKNINFHDKDIIIREIESDPSITRVVITKNSEEDMGELKIVFNNAPIALKKLEIRDAVGNLSTLTLENLRYGEKLNDQLFVTIIPKNPNLRN